VKHSRQMCTYPSGAMNVHSQLTLLPYWSKPG